MENKLKENNHCTISIAISTCSRIYIYVKKFSILEVVIVCLVLVQFYLNISYCLYGKQLQTTKIVRHLFIIYSTSKCWCMIEEKDRKVPTCVCIYVFIYPSIQEASIHHPSNISIQELTKAQITVLHVHMKHCSSGV